MEVNSLSFDEFFRTLRKTNRTLSFYVDWDKCLHNKEKISIALNHLNYLLGKEKKDFREAVNRLWIEMPKAFEVLPILIAVRDAKAFCLNKQNKEVLMSDYLENQDTVFNFICESGLLDIFSSKTIKDLNDFVFGIEVGLDSNARKNRGGKIMEDYLADIFRKKGLNFEEQVLIKKFPDLFYAFGKDIKKFDFVIQTAKKTFFIECNFYTSGGSKLNETARSYQELGIRFQKFPHYEFIWITDGIGWFESKNKLQEAYKSIEIYNLTNLNKMIEKIQNV